MSELEHDRVSANGVPRREYEELVKSHRARCVTWLRSQFPHGTVAEDATAEALLDIWRGRDRIRSTRLVGYLFVAAFHEALSTSRRLRMPPADPKQWQEPVAPSLDVTCEVRRDARLLLERLAGLRPQQRDALVARIRGEAYNETAIRLGRTYTWVNRHTREGKAALAEALAA